MRIVSSTALVALSLVASLPAGCEKHDPRLQALRSRLVLADEPPGAVGIAEVRDAIDTEREVAVIGRIQAGEFEPWAEGKAAFVMSEAPLDVPGHSHAAGHDASTCPFCKRRAERATATALVQFFDDQGELLAIDARRLFGLAKDQVVVVRGRGQVNPLGMLEIAATGIHLRR